MGQALHLKTAVEILPLHADQLFNVGEDGDHDCCKFIEKTLRNPKLVKSIQAVYRVLLTGKQGVVEQLVSPYNLWVPASPSPSPSPTSESSALASLETSNTAAATLTTSARRAQLSSKITNNIPFDGEGLEDVDAFWDKSVALAMDPSLPSARWPEGGAKPDDEVAAMYNLVHRSAELNEAANKAATEAANIAEEDKITAFFALERATHAKKQATAAILAEVKTTPTAVLADAEVTKSANIVALAAYAATKKTKIAEDEAAAKHVTKAANIAKAAEDEAAAKLVQEKAATAAILADAEVTKAANVAAALTNKAAEDEAAAKLVQEKTAAAAVLADEEATTAANAAAKLVEEKAALAAEETTKALAAKNVAEKLAVDEAAAKVMEEDLLRSLELTVSSDSHDSDTKTDSDTSPEDAIHAGKDDATAKLVQKLAEEDLCRKESSAPPVKSPTKKLTSALKNLESGYIKVDAGKRKRNPSGSPLLP
eukprot:scaffold8118_cov67-Attheya_sp.AAC.1